MRKVIGIGETILDIIFRDDQPIGAVPGGSVFNGLISLGRVGVNAMFISETGNDRVGRRIIRFLEENHVDASCVSVYPESKSPISLAFLNEQNDAEYIFYKDHPHDRLDFNFPDIQTDDIVMFGSFYAVNPVIRPLVFAFLEYARSKGAILYYDVNFRASHANEVIKVTPNILENLEFADVVRGSKEDFEVMYKKSDADSIYRSQISFYCKNFIYTRGEEPLELRAQGDVSKQYPIAALKTTSTIGAGDNFNAGFVYGLVKYGITREMLERGVLESQWNQVIAEAQAFSANVCQSIHNSVDLNFAAKKKQELEVCLKEMEEDLDIDLFESQYVVPEGMSYNSYLIDDEKIAVMDTADRRKAEEWKANLKAALGNRQPDYLVAHHMEPDHSALIAWMLETYPELQLVCSAQAAKMLSNFFDGFNFEGRVMTVKEGDTLSLGKHELKFITAAMVHWPEVIMSYDSLDKVLFSADGFGKFGALVNETDDWACEARRYYFNICGKYGIQVQNVLKKAATIDIQTICPLHGPVLKGEAWLRL